MSTIKYKKVRPNLHKKATTRKNIIKIYKGVDGYTDQLNGYDKKFALTYGEITLAGIQKLIDIYKSVHPISSYPSDQRVFYDLGSGIGKNVMMVASMENMLSKGVELVEHRHNIAMEAWKKTKKSVQSRVEFINKSFLDIPLHDAAWIFISNLCMSEQINKELADKLEKDLQKNTLIASSKPLPFSNNFQFVRKCHIPMTWDAASETFLYLRTSS
jgi:hypothetical protein